MLQLNRLYKYTCWTSDRNTPFPLGYRNMHDRIKLEGGLGPSLIVQSPSILTKKIFFARLLEGPGPPGPPLSTPVVDNGFLNIIQDQVADYIFSVLFYDGFSYFIYSRIHT